MPESEHNNWIKNPLSLYGLFMSVCYSITSGIMCSNFDSLTSSCERLPMIWFIVGFPTLLLITVTILVIFFPEKLYGPGDYKDEAIFYRLMTKEEKLNKQIEEVSESELINEKAKDGDTNDKPSTEIETPRIHDKISFIANCEKYVLSQVEAKLGITLIKDAYYITPNNTKIPCDALGRKRRVQYFIEAKYAQRLSNVERLLTNLRNQYNTILANYPDKYFRFLVAFAYEDGTEEDKFAITKFLKSIDNRIDVVFYPLPRGIVNKKP